MLLWNAKVMQKRSKQKRMLQKDARGLMCLALTQSDRGPHSMLGASLVLGELNTTGRHDSTLLHKRQMEVTEQSRNEAREHLKKGKLEVVFPREAGWS